MFASWIFSCLLVWTVCFHQGCLLFSQLALFSVKWVFFFSDSFSLVVLSPTCCLVCLVLSGRLAAVFLLICHGGLWQLIALAKFPPGIFHASLVNFLFLLKPYVSAFLTHSLQQRGLNLLPLSFPSLSLLLYCFHFDFSCLPPHPSTLSSSCFFPHRFTSFSLPFYSAVSPLPVVSTFSPSHSFSTRVSLYLTSNFPRCTLTCHHHNLLLAPTCPYLSPSLPLSYASILSFICSLSPSPTLPLAGVVAY